MNKKKVEIISNYNPQQLQDNINNWIEYHEKIYNVINISYCIQENASLGYSALILYEVL